MKQIFEWLRGAVKDASFRPFNEDVVYEESVQNIINEAEAKWEADCCEWSKPSKEHGFIRNPHTGRIFSNEPSMQNVYCNTCGKRIKILEVE